MSVSGKIPLLFFLLFIILGSCLKNDSEGIPSDILDVLERSGTLKPKLMRIIVQYQDDKDSLKLKAAYHIIRNLETNYTHVLVDSSEKTVDIETDNFDDLPTVLKYRDSLESIAGEFHYMADTIILDLMQINSDEIINLINTSYSHWNSDKEKYSFETYCKYILPYRVANEWIEKLPDTILLKLHNVAKNAGNKKRVSQKIDSVINQMFIYDRRLDFEPDPQKISSLIETRRGNMLDINLIKIKAMRAMGIASALDYTPYFTDSISNYFTTKVFYPEGSSENFGYTGIDSVLYNNKNIAKVYRRSFSMIANSLFIIKELNSHTPPYLGNYCYLDVTNEYRRCLDTTIILDSCSKYVYLSVKNNDELKAIDWSICVDGRVSFKDMGSNIIYTPTEVRNKKLIKSGEPFRMAL